MAGKPSSSSGKKLSKQSSKHGHSNGTDSQAPPRRSKTRDSAVSNGHSKSSKKKSHHSGEQPELKRSRSEGKRRDGSHSRSRSRSKSRSRQPSSKSQSHQHDDGKSKASTKKSSKAKNQTKSPTPTTKKPPNARSAFIIDDPNDPDKECKIPKVDNKAEANAFKQKQKAKKFETQAKKAIPAQVRMISGSHDSQTSADVGNINSQFKLPSSHGRAGGACTAALLQVLYNAHENNEELSWVEMLREMRDVLGDKGFDQIPQLTSSRMIDVNEPFAITPNEKSFNKKENTRRAVLIGINYEGQSGQLSGCHNDVLNVAKYLKDVQGFKRENITILMDDGEHKNPTKSAILGAYKKLVKESKDGDVVFCHYSGHGGRLADDNGDEDDGYDETLIPVDFQKSGQIRDDELLKVLVHPMAEGVTMTCLMDCCHSGTVLDLPYRFTADGDLEEMEMNENVDFSDSLWTAVGLAAGASAVGSALASALESGAKPELMILGGGPNAIHEYSDTGCCVVM